MRSCAAIAVTLVVVGGCRANPNYCADDPGHSCTTGGGDAPHDMAPPIDFPEGIDGPKPEAGATYRPTAVRFERSGNDRLTTGQLTGSSAISQRKGTYSVWLRFTATDGSEEDMSLAANPLAGGVFRTQQNQFRFWLPSCVGGTVLDMYSQAAYTVASGWIHVLASWDLTATPARADLYINDVADRMASPTTNNGDICYTAGEWGVGGLNSGTLDADVADLYAGLGSYIDIAVEANRRRFSDAGGKPVDLGADCSAPTGSQPIACLHGDLATWGTNKGNGGGFTTSGDGLTAAPTNPAD